MGGDNCDDACRAGRHSVRIPHLVGAGIGLR
jgi:hypothetical protein